MLKCLTLLLKLLELTLLLLLVSCWVVDIDICVIGEGEETLSDIVELLMDGKKLDYNNLQNIPGIAFNSIKYSKKIDQANNNILKKLNNQRTSIAN